MSNLKIKNVVILLAGLAILGLILFLIKRDSKPAEEIIKIGATFPITGPFSVYGEDYKNGALMAQDEINAFGGINGKKFEVNIFDNKGDVQTATSDTRYLLDVVNVPIILNSFEPLTKAIIPIVNKANKLMITFTTYRLSENDEMKNIFRDYWDSDIVGLLFGRALKEENAQNVGVIGVDIPSFYTFKKEAISSFGRDFTIEEKYQFGQKDFKTILLRMKEKNADTILIYAFPNEAGLIVRQMAEYGMDNVKLFSTELSESMVYEGNEEFLGKVKAISYLGSELSEGNDGFIEKYKKVFGRSPRPDAFYVYDEVLNIADAMRYCEGNDLGAENIDCLRNGISKHFDASHNRYRDLPLIQWKESGWQRYDLSD